MIQAYQKKLSGNRIGVVFGSFSPLHQGHLDIIYQAKKENDAGCIVIVCGYEGDKGEPSMPHAKRYRYVREFFSDDELVAVYAINDTEIGIGKYPTGWEGWLKEFWRIYSGAVEGNPERTWYVGEPDYKAGLEERGETAVLADRKLNPISGTAIRNNPIKNWDKITYPFRRVFSTNILIAGTASEGKTTMVKDLGKYFNSPYSWEWPRDYMVESCVSDWELDGEDFIAFLQGQHNLNKKLINSPANNGIFFADTDSMVTRMYAEYYSKDAACALTPAEFEKVAIMADEIDKKCRWDKIFLLCPKGVFVDDHSRFMNHAGMSEREELFTILCNNYKRAGKWDKVEILDKGYYGNFLEIKKYVEGIIENGKH